MLHNEKTFNSFQFLYAGPVDADKYEAINRQKTENACAPMGLSDAMSYLAIVLRANS